MPPRWVALTGTPGVGKTSVARILRRSGFRVVDGNRLAQAASAIVGHDRARGSRVVDPARVAPALGARARPGEWTILDSHWSHAVPGMRLAILLRLRPAVLRRRLVRRGWRHEKVRENVEAEGLGVIQAEVIGRFGSRRAVEFDTTGKSPAIVARQLARFLGTPDRLPPNLEIGRVDWNEDFQEWSSTATVESSNRS